MTVDLQSIKQRFSIIGNNFRLNEAIRVAVQVAPTDMSVLITGESGVGKEFFPRIIHAYSPRKNGKYIAVNCGAIPEGTIDSELFGHRKGSFTGAVADRKGYFEEANGGTIFLDEIGELPLSTQARLLRVLEGGDFIPVGSSTSLKTDVHIVAATNVKLLDAIRNGKFREDLFYRLSTVPIEIPALRERKEDIPLLFRRFASDSATKYNVPPVELTEEAKQLLMSYRWPGNIRELKNTAERMSLLEENRIIERPTVAKYLQEEGLQDLHPTVLSASGGSASQGSFTNEREILYKVLFDLNKSVNELKKQVDDIKAEALPPESSTPSSQYLPSKVIDSASSLGDGRFEQHKRASSLVSTEIASEAVEEGECVELTEQRALDALNGISLKDIERMVILRALERNDGVRGKTAEELGIADRTLYRRLKEYGIE